MIRDEWIDPEAVIEQHKACSPKPQENQANSKPTKKANPLKKRQKVERQITERQIGGNPESVERLIKVQQFPDDEEPFLRTCDICKCVPSASPLVRAWLTVGGVLDATFSIWPFIDAPTSCGRSPTMPGQKTSVWIVWLKVPMTSPAIDASSMACTR